MGSNLRFCDSPLFRISQYRRFDPDPFVVLALYGDFPSIDPPRHADCLGDLVFRALNLTFGSATQEFCCRTLTIRVRTTALRNRTPQLPDRTLATRIRTLTICERTQQLSERTLVTRDRTT